MEILGFFWEGRGIWYLSTTTRFALLETEKAGLKNKNFGLNLSLEIEQRLKWAELQILGSNSKLETKFWAPVSNGDWILRPNLFGL